MRIMIEMKAMTAQGFGGEEYYKDTYYEKRITQDKLDWMKQQFAIKYNVMIDMIEVNSKIVD